MRSSSASQDSQIGVTTPEQRMIPESTPRLPGLSGYVEPRMAIAIDGEIPRAVHTATLKPGGQLYLIPKIGGG